MSNQSVFDKTVRKLAKQGRASIVRRNGDARCSYESTVCGSKLHCAVGLLLTPAELREVARTGRMYDDWSWLPPSFADRVATRLGLSVMSYTGSSIINRLQQAHDWSGQTDQHRHNQKAWRRQLPAALRQIASDFQISAQAVDKHMKGWE